MTAFSNTGHDLDNVRMKLTSSTIQKKVVFKSTLLNYEFFQFKLCKVEDSLYIYSVSLVGATPRQGNYAMPQRTIVS